MKLILLGAPGSGKGTMAQKLTAALDIPQISTGDIFRKNLKEETPLGLQVKSIMASGALVPDEITIEIVKNRLAEDDCQKGYILDGFPRSIAQAKALDGFQQVDYAVNLDVDKEVVVKRLSGRRFCPDCSGTYHVSALSDETVCPHCGGKLIIRADDAEETVRERQRVYESTTLPLLEYYDKQGKLLTVDGNGTVEEVYDRILAALK
ncbi:MAG TPA: adenylate kinase [Candidatus Fimimonas merdipullorum]|uniref:Adenylate kinase n=1 Tax=Candidatus Fimimonas merdipullorum TaxID=2840822 RepID=A0A9D1SQB1_9BACT|nr:adenylate kinase [Candidatus Fimimonas merdipullorum]